MTIPPAGSHRPLIIFPIPLKRQATVMIKIYSAENGDVVGELSEEQFAFLQGQLEEESREDRDYYLTTDTIAMLEEAGADAELAGVLRAAIGDGPGAEVRWSRG